MIRNLRAYPTFNSKGDISVKVKVWTEISPFELKVGYALREIFLSKSRYGQMKDSIQLLFLQEQAQESMRPKNFPLIGLRRPSRR